MSFFFIFWFFFLSLWVFFFYLVFLSRPFTNHRTAGEGGGHFFNSLLPLPPASQTLRHQPGDYCRELTSGHSQQPDSNHEALVSKRKSLTTKVRVLGLIQIFCYISNYMFLLIIYHFQACYILLSISRSKGNQIIEVGQLIEYNKGNIFIKNYAESKQGDQFHTSFCFLKSFR